MTSPTHELDQLISELRRRADQLKQADDQPQGVAKATAAPQAAPGLPRTPDEKVRIRHRLASLMKKAQAEFDAGEITAETLSRTVALIHKCDDMLDLPPR